MIERLLALLPLMAGACLATAVVAAAGRARPPEAERWLNRRRPQAALLALLALPALRARAAAPAPVRAWLQVRLDRAGWNEHPDRFLALALTMSAALGSAGAAAGSLDGLAAELVLATAGAAAGAALASRLLLAAGAARRRRLLAELAPTLELACLELSAGSGAATALAAVARQTAGELSRELRLLLAASAIPSSDPLELRLRRLGERLDLPPLASVAAVIATSRDYGSGVLEGVRAVAVDLRRAHRRELIAGSRSALTRVLVPAAVGVLLPFMAILLYPAVTSLAANLR